MATSEVEVNVDSLVRGNNRLAFNLHKALARDEKNTFFCPFSISSVLSMILYGAKNETGEELRKCLGYSDMDNEALAKTFRCFITSLNNFPHGYTVSCANSIIVHKDFDVLEQYKSALNEYFKSLFLQADFVNESKATVEKINSWVKEKTNGMIPHLLDSLDNMTVMVLLNAVYFKGFWLKKFNEKFTSMQFFYNDGTEDMAKEVAMMHLTENFAWAEKESYKVLQLPYEGEGMSMLIFLPNSRDGLNDMEDMLTPDLISEIKEEMHECKLKLVLPKFMLEYSNNMKETFKELGLKNIFQRGADLGGIYSSQDLYVSEIIHKAVLEVAEEGCKAAAASTADIVSRAGFFNPEFIVDHPFAFVIYINANDLILFMGRVKEL